MSVPNLGRLQKIDLRPIVKGLKTGSGGAEVGVDRADPRAEVKVVETKIISAV